MIAPKLAVVAQSFGLSFFTRKNDNSPQAASLTWQALVERFSAPRINARKDGELFAPATFKGLRAKENVESVSLLVLDYDHAADFDSDTSVWRELALTFLAYTSHSHLRKTEKNPNAEQRFRVVIPLLTPIPAADYPRLWAWADERSKRRIDKTTSDASRMFFTPAIASKDAPFRFEKHEGSLLDWQALELPEATTAKRSAKNSTTTKAGDFVLDASAEPPQAKLETLCKVNSLFRQSFERKRKDFTDQSASSYDLSLATFALDAGWSEQETANLIIASRRKHGDDLKLRQDYFARTIAKARTKSEDTNKQATELVSSSRSLKTKQARIEELGVTRTLADEICEHEHFALDKGGLLYVYKGGVYVPQGEQLVTRRVKELLNDEHLSKKWTLHRANEVTGYISADAPDLWEHPSIDCVNVRNGIVRIDLESGKHKFLDHTPEHLSSIQLPVNYQAKTLSEFWEQFINETFPDDAHDVAYQIPAWLMIPDVSLQKAILLLGEGANGKSTYLKALRAFIGSRNTSSVSLQKLESNTFATAQLVGKLANICPDLPSTHLESTSIFKAIVGGDEINVERKNQQPFDAAIYARLIFSANHPPRSSDSSHAFFRRWVVLPFTRTFEENEQIASRILDARLSNAKELSGVLNRALEVLPQLLTEGFSESTKMIEARDEFRVMTDPLSVWLERETIEGYDYIVPAALLRTKYNAACHREGRPMMNENSFGRAFNRIKPHVIKKQRMYADALTWCYINVGLKV